MTSKWYDILLSKTPTEWCALMVEHTVPAVVALLSMKGAPTIDKLLALPWEETKDAGVYANFMILPSSATNNSHLYVGSATSTLGKVIGLNG